MIDAEGKLIVKKKGGDATCIVDVQSANTANVPSHVSNAAAKVRSPAAAARTEPRLDAPHSEMAEQGILGSMLLDPSCIAEVLRDVNPFFFYIPASKVIFETLSSQYRSGQPTDLITLTQVLRDRKLLDSVGGAAHITHLFTFVPTAANVRYYVDIVREKFLLREMIATGTHLVRAAHGKGEIDIPDLLASFGDKLDRMKSSFGGRNGATRMDLDELESFDALHDPNSLIGRRFLVRGGSWMIAGPTGCGKSSLLMQMAIHWSIGESMFGMKPHRPLKVLIFQAEDDFGDVAEQDQGVLAGIREVGELELDGELLRKNLILYLARGISGAPFLEMLKEYSSLHRPDIVAINPLFAYAGCDILDPSIGTFLRDNLFSIGVKLGYCTIVMHHVSKPPRDGTDAGNTMYLGFGSSEVQNSFRAVSTLMPLKDSPGVWKFDFGKRTLRAGAKNPDGSITDVLYMEHSKAGIYWLQVPVPESQKTGPRREYSIDDVLVLMSFDDPVAASVLQKKLHAEKDMPRRTFFRLWTELQDSLMITKKNDRWVISPNTKV